MKKKLYKQLVKKLVYACENGPEEWTIDEYTATYKGIEIWKANRPYADMRVRKIDRDEVDNRVRTSWYARKLRNALDEVALRRALKKLDTPSTRTDKG